MRKVTSIRDYQEALLRNEFTCSEAVAYYLAEINKKKHLNAFLEVFADEALQKAKQLDSSRKKGVSIGKLHGVVISIKDVICYKNHLTGAASKILDGFTSIYNATAIQRLLDEEAIIVGRCNCDEFAMGSTNENSAYGNVLNAFDETRVPGGSSGGSAVSVQANMCMLSLGSDTGGSVRQPADFCGIMGLKPTYGRISRYGLIAYGSSFDQIGIFGNNAEDIALVLEVMAGQDNYDSTSSSRSVEHYSKELNSNPGKIKVAYFPEMLNHEALDPEMRNSFHDFNKSLSEAGTELKPVEFQYLDYIIPAYYILTTAEASSNLSRYDGIKYGMRKNNGNDLTEMYELTRSKGFGKEVKRRIMLGTFVLSAGYYDAYFTKAQQVRKLLVQKTEEIFKEADCIIMPVSPSTAFKIGEKTSDPIAMYLADLYTIFANLTGIPGISIPLFQHSNGMPFGIQVMTKSFDEVSLLRIAHHWMKQFKAT